MKKAKVYADGYQLTILLFERTKAFPKALRPTLGRRLEDATINLIVNLNEASVQTKNFRIKKLRVASEQLDEIRILCQLTKDLKVMPTGAYGEVSRLTTEIGREIGGFLRHELRQQRQENLT